MISSNLNSFQMYSPMNSPQVMMSQPYICEVPLSDADQLPRSFQLLSDDDKVEYLRIKKRFQDEINMSRHGERLGVFISRLRIVRNFVNKDSLPSNRCKRMITCGIMFFDNFDALAINIQQLKILLGKCKSSINGSLQQLGYIAKPSTHEINQEIAQQIPFFKDDYLELKKWTIRYGKFPEDESCIHLPQKLSKKSSDKVLKQKKKNPKNINFEENQIGNFNTFQNTLPSSPPQPLSYLLNPQAQVQPQVPMMTLNVNDYQHEFFTDYNRPNLMYPVCQNQTPFQPQQQDVQSKPIGADEMMKKVADHFPCPAKCRHKLYDILLSSSIQTEA